MGTADENQRDHLINSIKNIFPLHTTIISATGVSDKFCANLHLKTSSKEEFEKWLKEHEKISGITYRVAATKPCKGLKVKVKRIYRCQHNTYPHSHKTVKSASKKHTGCPAKMTVTIKPSVQGKQRSKHRLLSEDTTYITLVHNHNHNILSAEAVKFKDPTEEVKIKFLDLFKSHHNPSRALELHKQDLMNEYDDDYFRVAADRSMCPDISWVYRLYYKVFKENFGGENNDFLSGIRQTISNLPPEKGKDKMNETQNGFVIVACPILMERVHELALASHIVFIDSSGNMDRFNCRVILLMTDSFVGGLPLGFMLTSSESEDTITTGLQMLKEILPVNAFGGKGLDGPETFMVDDSIAEQNALKTCFPTAKIWLCTFHILQAVWRWLWDSKHNVNLADRKCLYELFKKTVFAKNDEMFSSLVHDLLENETAKIYPNFLSYINALLKRAVLWGHSFRTYTRGNNTNNIVEVGMRVMKDKILNRTRAYNVSQLFHFLFDSLGDYYSRKIIDIISGRYESFLQLRYLPARTKNPQNVSLVVENQQCGVYIVKNQVANTVYEVNIDLGCCTCPLGSSGSPCKHQHAVARQFPGSTQNIVPLEESVRLHYHWIATGSKVVPGGWYAPLMGTTNAEEEDARCGHSAKVNLEDDNCNVSSDFDSFSVELETSTVSQTVAAEKKLSVIVDSMRKGLLNNSEQYICAIDKAFDRFNSMKTENDLLSAFHNFGQVRYAGKRSTYIAVQPTAIARRKMHMGGRKCLQTGRPPRSSYTQEHGYMKKKRSKPGETMDQVFKAPHNLQECVTRNITLGKKH